MMLKARLHCENHSPSSLVLTEHTKGKSWRAEASGRAERTLFQPGSPRTDLLFQRKVGREGEEVGGGPAGGAVGRGRTPHPQPAKGHMQSVERLGACLCFSASVTL